MKYIIRSIDHNNGSMETIDQNTKEKVTIEWDKLELDLEDSNNKTEFGFPKFKHVSISVKDWNRYNAGITLSPALQGAYINIEYEATKSGRAVLCDASLQKKTQL